MSHDRLMVIVAVGCYVFHSFIHFPGNLFFSTPCFTPILEGLGWEEGHSALAALSVKNPTTDVNTSGRSMAEQHKTEI